MFMCTVLAGDIILRTAGVCQTSVVFLGFIYFWIGHLTAVILCTLYYIIIKYIYSTIRVYCICIQLLLYRI